MKSINKDPLSTKYEPVFKQNSSLNQRAIEMINSKEYLQKIKKIHKGNESFQKIEFFIGGNIV